MDDRLTFFFNCQRHKGQSHLDLDHSIWNLDELLHKVSPSPWLHILFEIMYLTLFHITNPVPLYTCVVK